MISVEDQNSLFLVLSSRIKKDIECVALGGTAMMYKQYKAATKDIDLVFKNDEDRDIFIKAIKGLGYEEKAIMGIYPSEKSKLKSVPLIYSRGEERFDLFVKKVFKTEVSNAMIKRAEEIIDFSQEHRLRIKILADEDLILLKSITSRKTDYDDIEFIFNNNKNIDWNIIIDEAIQQAKKGDSFIILDLEETMQKLKKSFFIKKEFFDKIYKDFEKI